MPKHGRSPVWRSFRTYSKNRVQCLLCNRLITFTGSTSNMSRHLHNHSSSARKKPLISQRRLKQEAEEDGNNEASADDESPLAELKAAIDELATEDDAHTTERQVDNRRAVSKGNPLERRRRSNVWTHFDRCENENRARCQFCSLYFSFSGGSTGNLSRHLLLKHRIRVEAYWKSTQRKATATRPIASVQAAERLNKYEEPAEGEHYEEVIDINELPVITEAEAELSENGDQFDEELFAFGNQSPATRKTTTKTKSSIVWRYFVRIGQSNTQCKLCKRTFQMHPNNITNLRYHLYSVHHDLMGLEQNTASTDATPQLDDNSAHFEALQHFDLPPDTDQEMFVEPVETFYVDAEGRMSTAPPEQPPADRNGVTCQTIAETPSKTVERKSLDSALRKLLTGDLAAASPPVTYSNPFQSAVTSQHLNDKYQAVMQNIAHSLQLADYVALTAATWKASKPPSAGIGEPDTRSTVYLAITAHFIARTDWRMHAVLLNCGRLAGNDASDPTGNSLRANISHHLRHACQFWAISGKVFAIVTDTDSDPTDSDADAFGAAAELGWSRLQCLDRRLGDCVTRALQVNEFEALRLKIKSIVELFETDGEASIKFNYFQLQSGAGAEPGAMPQLLPSWADFDEDRNYNADNDDDESKRWRLTFGHLKRMCDLQVPLDAALEILRHDTRLSTGDWMAVRDVRALLQSVADALDELRSGTAVSTSKAIALLHGLNAQLAEYRSSEYRTNVSKELADQLQRNVRARMQDAECDLLLAVCTFLDPRFNSCGFIRPKALDICRMHVESLASGRLGGEHMAAPAATIATTTQSGVANAMWDWLDKQVSDQQRRLPAEKVLAQRELRFYAEQMSIERHADPLQWWRTRGSVSCPRLAQLARKYLALPATCAPSKRALATAERLLHGGWRLSGQSTKMVLFLQENIAYYEET